MTAYLLDTNVWLRAVQPAAPQHVLAVDALAALLGRGDDLFITAQNIIEYWSVATRPTDANGLGWSSDVATQLRRMLEARNVAQLDWGPCHGK